MSSDRARISYDEQRQYRAVIMQQGRVTVEADWNEEWNILNEETRKEILDIVGPCGTPDDGYRVVAAEQALSPFMLSSPFSFRDFSVTKGTMYVGGLRTYLPQDVLYSEQSDWIDHYPSIDFSPLGGAPEREFIYLLLREQEVGAVEDSVLREVALGGPDTAQRLRLVQRIMRMGTDAQDCDAALAEAVNYWTSIGYTFIAHDDASHDMRLMPAGTLQAGFQNVITTPDPCEPQASGGYLGADNQLIRVQVSQADATNNAYRLLWGYDNASFLYRVTVIDNSTLKLASTPVDDFHKPRQGQAVEILRSAVKLDAYASDTTDYMAAATGFVTTLQANYDTSTGYVSLNDALPPELINTMETPVLFLRVWEEELPFTLGTPVTLGDSTINDVTGIQVTIQVDQGEFLGVGTFWQIAVRPDTPTEIHPHRYLESLQPPDGPRIWVCPLAVIQWDDDVLAIIEDCRNHFDNLVDLSKRKLGGCCDVTLRPEDITESHSLQSVLDKYSHQNRINVCLMPGTYTLPRPLQLGPEHSNLTLESCHKDVIIRAMEGQENQFLDGLIVLNGANNVTFQGLHFALPLVRFFNQDQRGRSLIAGLNAAQLRRIVGAQLQNMLTTIGLRPLNCSALTVKDCYFEFPESLEQSLFGAGIFASGTCQGVDIQGNQFAGAGTLQAREIPFNSVYGCLVASAAVLKLSSGTVPTTPAAVAAQGATVVLPALQDASFRDNLFTGLAAAVFIYADPGGLRFERNTVQACYGGFWLLSQSTSTLAVLIDTVTVDSVNIAAGQQLYTLIAETLLDPLIQIGSAIARGYPLPENFDMSQAITVAGTASAPPAASTTTPAKQNPLQALFDKAFLPSIAEPASTTEKKQIKLNIKALTLANSLFLSGTGIGRFNTLHLLLAAAESEAVTQIQRSQVIPLQLDLHLSDNDIAVLPPVSSSTTTTAASSLSTAALVVWNIERKTGTGQMTMSANKLRNQSFFMPTAQVLLVEFCAITGNLIFNEEQQEPTGGTNHLSLFLVPGPVDKIPGVAVTGNVFRRTPFLPPRPAFANVGFPMNTWEFLNTVI